MEKDRKAVCDIISEMLENPDDDGLYHTSTAYAQLEHYIQQQRIEALGWAHAYACKELDEGGDPRIVEVPLILNAAIQGLSK